MSLKIEKILPVIASLFLIISGFFKPIVMGIGGTILLIISIIFLFRKEV
jgi:hypothetical protein